MLMSCRTKPRQVIPYPHKLLLCYQRQTISMGYINRSNFFNCCENKGKKNVILFFVTLFCIVHKVIPNQIVIKIFCCNTISHVLKSIKNPYNDEIDLSRLRCAGQVNCPAPATASARWGAATTSLKWIDRRTGGSFWWCTPAAGTWAPRSQTSIRTTGFGGLTIPTALV